MYNVMAPTSVILEPVTGTNTSVPAHVFTELRVRAGDCADRVALNRNSKRIRVNVLFICFYALSVVAGFKIKNDKKATCNRLPSYHPDY